MSKCPGWCGSNPCVCPEPRPCACGHARVTHGASNCIIKGCHCPGYVADAVPIWATVSDTPLPEPELRKAVFLAVFEHCEGEEEYAAGCMEDVMREVAPVVAELRAALKAKEAEVEELQTVAKRLMADRHQALVAHGEVSVEREAQAEALKVAQAEVALRYADLEQLHADNVKQAESLKVARDEAGTWRRTAERLQAESTVARKGLERIALDSCTPGSMVGIARDTLAAMDKAEGR